MKKKNKSSYLFLLPWSLKELGGVNQVVENLYVQMESEGDYEPIVMVNSWSDLKIRKQTVKNVDHYFFRLRSPFYESNQLKNLLAYFIGIFTFIKNLNEFLKINKVSVINPHYCNLFLLNISIIKYLKIYRGKFILSFHGSDFLNLKKSRGIERVLWRILLRSADKIITCSESLKNDILIFDQLFSENVVAIHNGINLEEFKSKQLSESNIINNYRKFILNVGSLNHIKGQDILLRSFAMFSNVYSDIDLVLIGRPAGIEDPIKKLIETLGLSNRVHLIEGLPHDQVLRFMEKAIVFVLPSRYEAFGIVILEVGSFGVPVVASDVGGVREILSHNETGILCDSENVEALAKAICRLLRLPGERERLGRNLRGHVVENFSWAKTYHNYLNVIDEDKYI